jgi:hypothetical protein
MVLFSLFSLVLFVVLFFLPTLPLFGTLDDTIVGVVSTQSKMFASIFESVTFSTLVLLFRTGGSAITVDVSTPSITLPTLSFLSTFFPFFRTVGSTTIGAALISSRHCFHHLQLYPRDAQLLERLSVNEALVA